MSCEVRPAAAGDLPEIDRIQRASPEAVCWRAADYLEFVCRVAVADGRVAGFLATRALGTGQSEILNLAVEAGLRRRGVGGLLLKTALAEVPGEWFLEVRESNASAQQFYRAMGFQEVGRRYKYYQDNGETAVVMRLQACYCHR